MKKVTIQQVAKEAGTSVCTVSRIINKKDAGKVSQPVKDRVLDVIKKYNFRPNTVAKNLISGKSGLFGVQVVGLNRSSSASDVLNHLEIAAWNKGYSIILGVSDWSRAREKKSIMTMIEKGIDGLIWFFVGKQPAKTVVQHLKDNNLPTLMLLKENAAFPSIIRDESAGTYLAYQYLAKKHKSIALLTPDMKMDIHCDIRTSGFQMGQKNMTTTTGTIINTSHYFSEEGYLKTLEILKSKKQITGIIATSMQLTLGAYRAIRSMNLKIGEDISVICVNDDYYSQDLDPSLTVVSYDQKKLANNAVNLIIKQITGKTAKDINISPFIVSRMSCGENK